MFLVVYDPQQHARSDHIAGMMYGRILEKNKFMFQINRFHISLHIGNGAILKHHNAESIVTSPCRKNNSNII